VWRAVAEPSDLALIVVVAEEAVEDLGASKGLIGGNLGPSGIIAIEHDVKSRTHQRALELVPCESVRQGLSLGECGDSEE